MVSLSNHEGGPEVPLESTVLSLVLLIVSFALFGSGVWVAVSLLGFGTLALGLYTSTPIGLAMVQTIWGAGNSWELAALPMFIWMGDILTRSRLSEDMFRGLAPWMNWIPGRLMHFNILGSGILAAASGSSAATAVTIGRMSIPELRKRGYDEAMSIGTLAGSGTLGFLIPPSIMFIVYGVAAEVSIARLFIAGIFPGILLIILFMGYVVAWAVLNPERQPPGGFAWAPVFRSRRVMAAVAAVALAAAAGGWAVAADAVSVPAATALAALAGAVLVPLAIQPMPPGEIVDGLTRFRRGLASRVRSSLTLVPILILIFGILGTIYLGIASPTDAAAVGVFFSLVLSWAYGTLTWESFSSTLMSATRITCMLGFMLAGASFLSVAMGFSGIPRDLAAWIATLDLSPYTLILALTVFYGVLGCFLDGISMTLLSVAIVMPMIEQAGIDPVWFGVFLVLVAEMAQVTPPVGVNLFVLQGLTGKDLIYVTRATLPFFLLMVAAIVIVTLFPEIATYLPDQMFSRAR